MDLPKGKRIIVDANVVLRYLLRDNEELYKLSEEIFEKILKGSVKAFIPIFVFAEIVYVLQKVYKVDRKTISETLKELLKLKGIKTENRKVLEKALDIYATKNLDFADCLLCAYSENYEIVSFYRNLIKCIGENSS